MAIPSPASEPATTKQCAEQDVHAERARDEKRYADDEQIPPPPDPPPQQSAEQRCDGALSLQDRDEQDRDRRRHKGSQDEEDEHDRLGYVAAEEGKWSPQRPGHSVAESEEDHDGAPLQQAP